MKTFKTEGIILRRVNFGEADKILTILTYNHGKIRSIAKGVRKTTSRKASSLEQFSYSRIFLAEGRNFYIITEAETINLFSKLRHDLKIVGQAYKICELLDRLVPENQTNRSLFNLTLSTLERLNTANSVDTEKIVDDFSFKMLVDLGYIPSENAIGKDKLEAFLEEVSEKKLKSKQLLTQIDLLS